MSVARSVSRCSRRSSRLASALALGLSAAGCATLHPHSDDAWLVPAARDVVESRFVDGHVVVRALAGGRPAWLLLDTGAQQSMVSPALAQRLGLQAVAVGEAGGAGGPTRRALLTGELALGLGAHSVRIPSAVVWNVDSLPLDGVRVDGLLGTEILGQGILDVDYPARVVRFHPYSQAEREAAPLTAPLTVREGVLVSTRAPSTTHARLGAASSPTPAAPVPANVLPIVVGDRLLSAPVALLVGAHPETERSVPATLVLDTGAEESMLGTRFVREHGLDSLFAAGEAATARGLSGDLTLRRASLRALRLGALRFDGATISVAEGAGDIPWPDADGLLGSDVLREFRLVIDLAHRRALLAPPTYVSGAGEAAQEWRSRDVELEGRPAETGQGSTVSVARVRTGSLAERQGLRVGDQLIAVDGFVVRGGDTESLQARLDAPRGKLSLVLGRNGRRRPVALAW